MSSHQRQVALFCAALSFIQGCTDELSEFLFRIAQTPTPSSILTLEPTVEPYFEEKNIGAMRTLQNFSSVSLHLLIPHP